MRPRTPVFQIALLFVVLSLTAPQDTARSEPSSSPAAATAPVNQADIPSIEKLGRELFHDRNLSITRRQACVSCHSPELAFTDPRELGPVEGAVSRGADGVTLGDRNAPTLTYISSVPRRAETSSHETIGGLFHDGRAEHLEAQAGEPLLNPREMAMPDKATVVARLRENPLYVRAFAKHFESDVLDNEDRAFAAMARALAAYERSKDFESFDSKFDRVRAGHERFTMVEQRGHDIFFDARRSSCVSCHSSATADHEKPEVFSNFTYVNLSLPKNATVRALNGFGEDHIDHGIKGTGLGGGDGAFRVPTLRNVSITAPYMHNGSIKELRRAIEVHARCAHEPSSETGSEPPEVACPATSALIAPQLLDADSLDALVAFLGTLTDRRYEHLLAHPQAGAGPPK